MKHRNLKRGIYTSPQSGTQEIERYVIENEDDLNKLLLMFPFRMTMFGENLKQNLKEGRIILVTDEHPLTQQPTYCFETTDVNNNHPSSFHRVRLVEN
jgi:hypothetical protein